MSSVSLRTAVTAGTMAPGHGCGDECNRRRRPRRVTVPVRRARRADIIPSVERLDALDRELGRRLRRLVGPRLDGAGRAASALLGPVFRVTVAALVLRRADRRTGVAAGLAAVGAASLAERLRRRIGRRRPDARWDGPGFPSRHAAAATAIATAVTPRRPGLGRLLGAGAAVGLVGRVADGRHDPADIAAGAALGAAIGRTVGRLIGGRP